MSNYKKLLVKIFLPCVAAFIFFPALAQNITVSGRVSDSSNNSPVANASVTVKGRSSGGTVTDVNGNFKITVAKGAVLVISSFNYQTEEVAIGDELTLNIILSPKLSELNQVVVIGYGTRKKKDVTGAVSTVGAKEIEKSTAMTPELALQGRAPGVFVISGGGEPQARPLIRIRGVNTFGYSEPLYVVDGIPIYEGGSGVTSGGIGDIRSPVNIFSLINPADIESISVLKDASSAAIYGVRASNGVILITTKKGKSGKPRVEGNLSYGIQNFPKTIPLLNTQQYFDLVEEAYNNNPDRDQTTGTVIPIGEKFGSLYDPGSSQYAGNGPTYDWVDQLKNKNASLQDYNVKVSGGTENFTYYFSAGYTRTESPLKSNVLSRYTLTSNIDAKISRFISTGLNLRLVQENALVNTQSDLNTMMSTIPFQPFFDNNDPTGFAPVVSGSFVANPDYDPNLLNPGAPYIFDGDPVLLWGTQTRYNVFAFQELNNTKYDLYNLLGNAYVQIEPITGLRFKASLGGSYYFNLRKTWGAFDAWRFNQTPGNPYAGQDGNSKGSYGERQGRTDNINKELSFNYSHTFYKDHSVDILLNASEQSSRWYWTDLSGQVNYSDPQFRSINNQPPFTQGAAGILQEDDLIGYMGRISYKYKDKYYLDATLRYDGSSRLAPGHKWDKFPSFGVAWRISSENFFPKTNFINDLKLRGGYGKLGNYQTAAYYAFLSSISLTPDYPIGSGNGDPYGTQTQGASLPNFANTTLTWEKLRTTTIGFDAQLFNNHVSLTAEYYSKLTYDMIQTVSLPPNTGIESPANLNIGEVSNKGIEVQVGYNTKFGEVEFNVSGNITTVKNRVEKLYLGTPLGDEFGRIEEGYSMFYLWGYKVGGVFQNQSDIDTWRHAHADENIGQNPDDPAAGYQYQLGDMYFQDVYGNPREGTKERYSPMPDSLINNNDRTYLGKTIPGYYYGLNLSASYKGIDISVFFQGVGDVQRYNSIKASLESMGSLANQSTKVLDRWSPDNPSTTMPRAVYNDPAQTTRISDRYVEDAGYFRLKNLQIGYSFPKKIFGNLGFMQNLRIYASGINLFTITNWTGLDPEADSGSGPNLINSIPPTKQFVFGMNATF